MDVVKVVRLVKFVILEVVDFDDLVFVNEVVVVIVVVGGCFVEVVYGWIIWIGCCGLGMICVDCLVIVVKVVLNRIKGWLLIGFSLVVV